VTLTVSVTDHALDRFQEHYPKATEQDVLKALAVGTPVPGEVVAALTKLQRRQQGSTYRLYRDGNNAGLFTIDDGAVITYLRLSAGQLAIYEDPLGQWQKRQGGGQGSPKRWAHCRITKEQRRKAVLKVYKHFIHHSGEVQRFQRLRRDQKTCTPETEHLISHLYWAICAHEPEENRPHRLVYKVLDWYATITFRPQKGFYVDFTREYP